MAVDRGCAGVVDVALAGDPLFGLVIERHDIGAGQEQPVIGAHGGDKILTRAGVQQRIDHRVDGWVGDAGEVEGAVEIARFGSPSA